MNRSKEILNYLSMATTPKVVLVAPNAPPVSREADGICIAMDFVFSAQDASDTLMAFRTLAPAAEAPVLDLSGTFSFGVQKVGRFRVTYGTQRGSRVFSIGLIPFVIPELDKICQDRAVADRIVALLSAPGGGALAVFGPSALSNSMLVYACLQKVNESMRKVIYVLERSLTFLLSHDESIILQSEVSTDLHSLEEGLRDAFRFEPHIAYVGDIWPTDDLPSLVPLAESGVFTILSSVSMNGQMLLDRTESPLTAGRPRSATRRAIVKVFPAKGERLSIDFAQPPPPA
jgi:twitching motility protein PilT